MKKRAVLYLRVSDKSQVNNFSLGNQELICNEHCKKNNYEVIRTFIEPGESAKTDDRPEFQKMLFFCRKKENNINTVVFYHSSRFSRDTKDFLCIQADLARFAINLDSVTEPMIKELSPEAKLYTTIVSSFNQYENQNKARNTTNGMKRRFLEGYPISTVPIGYILVRKPCEKSQAFRDDKWWDIIKNMWERIINEKLTLRSITRELNKYGLKKFSRTTTWNIFKNCFYYGMLRSPKYGEVLGKHEPMITKDQFFKVQAVFSGHDQSSPTKTHFRSDFMLRGLLICSECDHQLSSCYSKGKRNKFAYYLCSARGLHKIKNYPRDLVENKFIALLRSLQPTKSYMQFFTKLILEKYEAKNKVVIETKNKIQSDIIKLEEMLKTLKEKHLQGLYDDKELVEMKNDLETRIMAKRNILLDKEINIDEVKLLMVWLESFLPNLEKIFIVASPEIRQVIGCSIFPDGLIFKDGDFQTPKIACAFKLKSDFITPLFKLSSPYRIRTGDFRDENPTS